MNRKKVKEKKQSKKTILRDRKREKSIKRSDIGKRNRIYTHTQIDI